MPVVYPYGHVFALWSEKLVCRKALEGYREGQCTWAAINCVGQGRGNSRPLWWWRGTGLGDDGKCGAEQGESVPLVTPSRPPAFTPKARN